MIRLQNHLIGVEQGNTRIFSDFNDDGPMWSGTGSREVSRRIRFGEPFRKPPAVHVSLSLMDMAAGSNPRIEVRASDIARDSFQILVHTWNDTRIARASVSWMAIGELPHEDDWELS